MGWCGVSALVWSCDVCGRRVAGGAGYLFVDRVQLAEHEDRMAVWEAEQAAKRASRADGGLALMFASDFASMPNQVPWRVAHAKCDPHPESEDYWVPVERVDSVRKVLDWTLHLHGKGFLDSTNWVSVVRGRVLTKGVNG